MPILFSASHFSQFLNISNTLRSLKLSPALRARGILSSWKQLSNSLTGVLVNHVSRVAFEHRNVIKRLRAHQRGSTLPTVRTCSTVPVVSTSPLPLRTCKRRWCCVLCSRVAAYQHGVSMADAFASLPLSAVPYAGVLTASHKVGDPLGQQLKLFRDLGLTNTRRARAHSAQLVYGYARVIEVTHGANGWHAHAHIAYFGRDERSCEAWWRYVSHVHAARASQQGRYVSPLANGAARILDVRDVAAYFGKGTLLEFSGVVDRGEKDQTSVLRFYRNAAKGCHVSRTLVAEYERATTGLRGYAISWLDADCRSRYRRFQTLRGSR